MSRRAMAAALALSFAVVGCSSEGRKAGDEAPSCPTWPECQPLSAAPGTTTPAVPQGYARHLVDGTSVTFAGPSDWTPMDPKTLIAANDPSDLQEAAARLGVTVEAMVRTLGNASLVLVAPPVDGVSDTISVHVLPSIDLPTEAQLGADLHAVARQTLTIESGSSAAGPLMTATYVAMSGDFGLQSQMFLVEDAGGVVSVTVAAMEPGVRDRVGEVVQSTLHRA